LTERLFLRPPTEADAELIFTRYTQDAEVCRYVNWTPHQSIDDARAYLRRITCDNAEGRSPGFLIFDRASGELLGSVGGGIDQHRMQFGYCLARDAWGRGYASEASRAFADMAFEIPQIQRLQAFCDVENSASARVLEKTGLQLEGILRCYMVLPNLGETPRDMYCYAMIRDKIGA